MKNAKLAFGLSDAALGELHRQIEDKAERLGGLGLWAPRFFPASKRCSACGDVMAERDLSVREWNCPSCGVSHDRDSNAATNPLWLAELAMTADEAAAKTRTFNFIEIGMANPEFTRGEIIDRGRFATPREMVVEPRTGLTRHVSRSGDLCLPTG